MVDLHIADRLWLPLDGVTETFAFLGKRGNGKTYAAMLLAEQMLSSGAQVVALDPVGVWWGLRLDKDGVTPGFPIPVFGGLHGDIPLQPTAGALMADVVCDRGTSAVLDVSRMITAEQAKFGYHFAKQFFQRKKAKSSAVHLFIEEAQEFVPQNLGPGGGEAAHMLHEFQRVIKLGRNFGIGVSLISQRPQEVNKKVLNMTECLFAFQMTGVHERKAIREWTTAQGIDPENFQHGVMDTLPTLKKGHPVCWSPQWLQISRVVKIREKLTMDVSATPKVGAKAVEPTQLGELDLAQIEEAMAATIERAKAEDPKELRKRIRTLERQLEKAPTTAVPEPKTVEVPVLRNGDIERLESVMGDIKEYLAEESSKALERARSYVGYNDQVIASLNNLATTLDRGVMSAQAVRKMASGRQQLREVAARRERVPPEGTRDVPDITGPEGRVLRALEWLEVTGLPQPGREIVGFVARYSPSASSFTNPCGSLRSKGYIEYPEPGLISLTDAGRALVDEHYDPPEKPATPADLHAMVLAKLTGPQGRLLRPLLEAYPASLSNEELARLSRYSAEASSFTNPRGSLRSMGLVVYPSSGMTQAAPFLFFD